ncbi:MAG: 3-dehydroquinate synthase [Clostridia bacterium]|nr:3-dehydroquinate synthase [Clostridia bacterium]
MERVRITASHCYDVLIGPGLIRRAGEEIAKAVRPCKAAVITDDTVKLLYGKTVVDSLRDAGFDADIWAFPHGERSKTMATLARALEWLGESGVSRSDLVVALGGGVPGDLAGFAAAVYDRGIRFVQIPTTLLAAVDSSVGGKTAVDLAAGKNMAGAFHQPEIVLCDTDVIRDLPAGLKRDGLAEMLKYGVLCDPELFSALHTGAWEKRMEQTVARCVAIKRDYVAGDEKDNGRRQFLNLGHTFGHAVEKCSGFTLTHGQGVGVGMVMAARAAGIDPAPIADACLACGLPIRVSYTAGELAEAALRDKKRRGGKITLVLPETVGKCYLKTVPIEDLPAIFVQATGEAPCK